MTPPASTSQSGTDVQNRDDLIVAQQTAFFEYAAAIFSINASSSAAAKSGTGVIRPLPIMPSALYPASCHTVPIPVQYSFCMPNVRNLEYETEQECDRALDNKKISLNYLFAQNGQREDNIELSSSSSEEAANV